MKDLLAGSGATVPGDLVPVGGINADSRAIEAGDVFFALPGSNAHGDEFGAKAVARGAVAMVSDRTPVHAPGAPVIIVDDVRRAYARAAARVAGPQPEVVIAVTGTNGKTSIVSFVRQIWTAAGLKAASIGTLGIDREGIIEAGELTTPDPLTLHRELAELEASGIDHVALEASSHGLEQRRLDGLEIDVAAYTNLSRDHLDYHETMDEYREAKLRLFRDLMKDGGAAVVNSDDPEHMPFMFGALERGATLMTVGEEGAYIEVGSVVQEGFGQRVTGKLVGEPLDFHLPLTGAFQVSNALVAAAIAMASGVEQKTVIGALETLKGATGRLEMVAEHNGAAIFIDYSHTPGALETVLGVLRPYATGTLWAVFGVAGDRDPGKRALMGEVAGRLADKAIVTDDNPRTEDAAAIRAEIMAAAPGAEEIGDRAEAIRSAIGRLTPGDVLLIAGKGHEDYQIIGTAKHHFSDHEVVLDAIKG